MFTLELKTKAMVDIKVTDMFGQVIETLHTGKKPPGSYQYRWIPASIKGGIYLCRIYIDGMVETRKWIKSRNP
jgi:hypothetical protein